MKILILNNENINNEMILIINNINIINEINNNNND